MKSAVIITCNSDLFIGIQLGHIYKHFDRIVIVDGPSMPSKETRGDGRRLTKGRPRSTDNTIEIIQNTSDPDGKIKLISNKSPWISKTHKFNAALAEISPGVIWQIDCDEFYYHQTYEEVFRYLDAFPRFTDIEFYAYHFWSSPELHCGIDWNRWGNMIPWRRVFRFYGRESWERHEPPRMTRPGPNILLNRDSTIKRGWIMFHYGYCMMRQFKDREIYYNLPSGRLTDELNSFRAGKSVPRELFHIDKPHPIPTSFLYDEGTRNLHGTLQGAALKGS